jgi:hypothetical protein
MDDEQRQWTVEDHLRDAAPEQVALYRQVEELIRSCGEVTLSVSKTTITFKGARRGFAGARPVAQGVRGYLDLTRSLAGDRRIRRSDPYTKRLFVNHYLVTSPADLDETFRGWVREAYGVGQGDHLRS